MLSKLGEIRRDDGCLDFSGGINEANKDDKIIVYPCHGMKGNQQWMYTDVSESNNTELQSIIFLTIIFCISITFTEQPNSPYDFKSMFDIISR